MQPWKIIENDQNFCRNFRFSAEISNFLAKIFFHRFYTSRPSFVRKISFVPWKPDFISILVENCQFWVTPPYFGPHVLTPLRSGPVPKMLHIFLSIRGNDKKVVHKKVLWDPSIRQWKRKKVKISIINCVKFTVTHLMAHKNLDTVKVLNSSIFFLCHHGDFFFLCCIVIDILLIFPSLWERSFQSSPNTKPKVSML